MLSCMVYLHCPLKCVFVIKLDQGYRTYNMKHLPIQQTNELRAAVCDRLPIATGYLPISAAFGLLLVQSGLAWYWAVLMSFVVFAGSVQFLSIPLLATGVPLWEIATATLLVNFRHVFYGLSFPAQLIKSRLARLYSMFCITDEVYSLITSKKDKNLSARQLLCLQMLTHIYWCLGTLFGALAGEFLPDGIQGLEFTLTALFVVLALEQTQDKNKHPAMCLALIAGIFALSLQTTQFLLLAIALFLGLLTLYNTCKRMMRGQTHGA